MEYRVWRKDESNNNVEWCWFAHDILSTLRIIKFVGSMLQAKNTRAAYDRVSSYKNYHKELKSP